MRAEAPLKIEFLSVGHANHKFIICLLPGVLLINFLENPSTLFSDGEKLLLFLILNHSAAHAQ